MKHPAILLDRDGTLIVEKNYLSDPAEVRLERGVTHALSRLNASGFLFAVVSNQSGVGRGYFDMTAVSLVNRRVAELLAEAGIEIAGWYTCPHAPNETCNCRKPLPGLARQAEQDLDIDLTRSWVIGDKKSDVALAEAIGARGILVLTGHGAASEAWARSHGYPIAGNLEEAADIILAATGLKAAK